MENETNVSCDLKKPMHVAVQNGDIEEIEALAKSGVKINQVENGQTPLHRAIIIGETLAARKLISLGANLRTRNKDGFTPLHMAVLSDNVSLSDLLIDRDFCNDIDTFDKNGNTALHMAVWLGKVNTVRTLFIKGANADLPNKEGHTSLHIAIIQENSDVLDVVLEYVSNPNILDKKGFRPLHLAVLHNRIDAIRKIGEIEGIEVNDFDGKGNSALHLAAKVGNCEAIDKLFLIGADMNLKNSKRYPPIHLAVLHNKLKAIKSLESCGAQIDSVDRQVNTPVHLAAKQNNIKALKLLNHLAANINLRNAYGSTPLHSAIMANHYLAVKVLLDLEADLFLPNSIGVIPLHLAACASNNRDIIETLFLYRSGGNFLDGAGNTPLHLAAKFCNFVAIEALIDNGANLNLKNNDNLTALDITMRYVRKDGRKAAAKYITDLHERYNFKRAYPLSPLQILNSAKSILKLEILRNFECTKLNEPEYISNIIPILQNYINDCFAEVRIMKSTLVPIVSFHEYLTLDVLGLLALIRTYRSEFKTYEVIKAEDILNHMLDTATTKGYPIYHNYATRQLIGPSLLERINKSRIYTRYNYNGKVTVLISDVIPFLVKHLEYDDVYNLLLAYSASVLDFSDVKSSNINKRKLPELKTASCMDDNYVKKCKIT